MASEMKSSKVRALLGLDGPAERWLMPLGIMVAVIGLYIFALQQLPELQSQAAAEGNAPAVGLVALAGSNFLLRVGGLVCFALAMFVGSARTILAPTLGFVAAVVLGCMATIWHGVVIGGFSALCLALSWSVLNGKSSGTKLGSASAVAIAVLATFCLLGPGHVSVAHADEHGVSDAVKKAVAEKLSHSFKNFTYDDIKPSEIPGIYEVYSGPRIIYYAPDQDVMIFGELYRTDGKSITAQKVAALQDERAQKINHDAGVAIGDDKGTEVLAFIDPDCGYCKRAHEWLRDQQLQGKIKEVVYFMPLKDRPDALAKAENLVCAPPALRSAALDQLWSRAPVDSTSMLKCDDAGKKLALEADEARRFGVVGTPTFVVKGQVVAGFDRARLQTLLSTQSTTE